MVTAVHQKKVGQRVVEHSLPLSTNTNGTGMVSPSEAGFTASVKSPTAVLTGVDTLVLTAGGGCAPSFWLQEQAEVWEQYHQQYEFGEEYVCIQLGNSWFQLYPYGSNPYKYQLHNPEIGFIKVWNPNKWSSGVSSKQQLHIQLTSKFIHSYSIEQLTEKVKELCSHFVENTTGLVIQISRLDLHTDIVSPKGMLSYEEVSNSITRCKVRTDYFEDPSVSIDTEVLNELRELSNPPRYCNKGGQKLITPDLIQKFLYLYDNQVVNGANSIVRKRELETTYFGKLGSDIWGKIYNKTTQVRTKNDTDTPKLWEQNGWNGKDTVVRVEFSMKRGFLKELDNGRYVILDNLTQGMNKIWDYLTTKWLRLVEEVKENNTTWSKITQFWCVVQSSFTEVASQIIRKKCYNGKINQLWKQGIGCIKQMISMGMNNNEDTMFLVATKQALEITLSSSSTLNEYYKRRQVLGIA